MQYRKHNVVANLTALVDGKAITSAWELLTGEINELSLDKKMAPKLEALLLKNGQATGTRPTAKQLGTWTLKLLFAKPATAADVATLIIERHTDQYVNNGEGVGQGQAAASAITTMLKGADQAQVTKRLAEDLARKQSQRGITVGLVERLKNNPLKTGIGILAVAGLIYAGCRIYAGKPL